MQIGLIGCGNMARALARGWGRPVLCTDPIAERAHALVGEVGGEALASNSEVAARADLVLLVQPHATVCLNRYPFTTSHLLIAPRRHVADLQVTVHNR